MFDARFISIVLHYSCFLCHLFMQVVREQPASSFTQEDLNQGLIIYHQQVAGGTNDSVLLEATNGVTKVGPISLEIDIIPLLLPLQVKTEHSSALKVLMWLDLTADYSLVFFFFRCLP